MAKIGIRIWYLSTQRMLELVDLASVPPRILGALQSPDPAESRSILANMVGQYLWAHIERAGVQPLYRLIAEGHLAPGIQFVHQGGFVGKGFGLSNRSPSVSLSTSLSDVLPGKKLTVEFSKNGLLTDTAYSRLSGSSNVLVFGSITEVEETQVRAVPYLVGDLIEQTGGAFDIKFTDRLSLPVQEIDQFKRVNFKWRPTPEQFDNLRHVPEAVVKSLFSKLLGEALVQKDWGGEECDIFSSNLSVDGTRCTAAFLLKGPAAFHEMRMADCGKNGDQIYRLFNTPAELFVVQHCHRISTAVRKTVEAFALSNSSRKCRYTLIDGYDTARILRSNKLL
jgi:hypothetical protein